MFSPGWSELVIFGFIALMLFGKRLPEVARSLGQGLVEFKKGMRGFETEMNSAVYSDPPPRPANKPPRIESDLKPSGEKFELDDNTNAETSSDLNSPGADKA